MPSPVPTPLAAAIGLVPAVLSGVRSLPGRAVQLPVFAVSSALATLDRARRDYDDLAVRGERLIAKLRGTSFDELEDRVEDRLQGTPLARPYDAVEDALEDAGAAVTNVASTAARTARSGGGRAVGTVADLTERAAQRSAGATKRTASAAAEAGDTVAKAAQPAKKAVKKAAKKPAETAEKAAEQLPEAEQPKGEPTPKATQPDETPVGTAATPDVVETVEQVAEHVTAPEVTDHDDLPLPDYDHMTLGSLRGRLRSLTVEQLVQVRDYEKAHADRLPVVTMLDNRIAKLATDSSATPSGGDPAAPAPDQAPAAGGGSKVQPATGGPAQNPPSAGDPTNPAQPRSSGSGSSNPDSTS